MAYPSPDAPGRRAARLSVFAISLLTLAFGFVVLAVVLSLGEHSTATATRLPVPVTISRPAVSILLAALAAAAAVIVGLAALQAAVAMRVLERDRRIPSALSAELRQRASRLLGPVAVSAFELDREIPLLPTAIARPAPGDALRLTVLVPAHNEEAILEASLSSLRQQSRRPDRVVVIADNCTDATADIARACGAEVVHSEGNTELKAGALNQVLGRLIPETEARDAIMMMDADSVIGPEFLSTAMGRLEADRDLMAVGGVFYGERGGGLVGQLQRNEFSRYQRYIERRRGKVFVLTGTASVFRAFALRAVAEARGSLVPGSQGHVYDTLALTEDNELTLALKTLGARMVSPRECQVVTEIMPNLRALWRQRSRWQRGALENIGAYSVTRTTALYWGQQLGIGYGVIALNAYLLLMTITLLAADGFQLSWFWVAVGCIFVVERVVTVARQGWRGMAIAAVLVIEIGYDLVLQAVYVKSLVDIATGRASGWNTVPREAATR